LKDLGGKVRGVKKRQTKKVVAVLRRGKGGGDVICPRLMGKRPLEKETARPVTRGNAGGVV